MAKYCENSDGPANFEGFGHVFCWRCYGRFMLDQNQYQAAKMASDWQARRCEETEKTGQLNLKP